LTHNLSAQQVELHSLPLAGKEAKLYYFAGAKIDSLLATVDARGKAAFTVPQKDYKGMATLIIPEAGGIEMIVAEPEVLVECNVEVLNNETSMFPRSEENNFLRYIFTAKSRYMQQQAWLKAGAELFSDSPVFAELKPELEKVKVDVAMQALDEEISSSKLYAAKYYRLADFMNRMFNAEQKHDLELAKPIRKEMEEDLDIVSLYTSGRLWGNVLNFYISVFNKTLDDSIKQKEYAVSILKTSKRLSDPYFEAYLVGCVTEMERFGWQKAEYEVIKGLLEQYKGFEASPSYPNLQRAIGAYRVGTRGQMPTIIGLDADVEAGARIRKSAPAMLIVFHDSDCGHCINEMAQLVQLYPQLKEKGIRVVSIASDTDKTKFAATAAQFPWPDKLCDFKGSAGENFANYNVVGSPSFYLVDKDRKLLGLFYSAKDVNESISKLAKRQ
jgi:peroxiredoxin